MARRIFWPPIAAAILLAAIIALRFVFPEVGGIMLFAVFPIALLGMMLGPRAGVGAAAVATAAYLLWAFSDAHPEKLEYVAEPATFFALGLISGYFAHGVLGDYDWRRAVAIGELRQAIVDRELCLHYQPIVRGLDGLLAVEALSRWQHPKHGLLPPSDFIPTAEADDEICWQFTLYTLEVAAKEARNAGVKGDTLVSVNLSPVGLRKPDLPEQIDRVMRSAKLPVSGLAIEVTEGVIAAGDASVVEALERVRSLGVGMIAIDDFGVGHSSLARLGRLPINALKIDRTMISELGRADTHAIVAGIIDIGQGLDLTVVAEGVEDEQTWATLREMGCDAVQGFHLSRPLPAADLRDWIAGGAKS